MPETITITDPRYRTKHIVIDLSDPKRYRVTIQREAVREVEETGAVYSRTDGLLFQETVEFDANDVPSGDARVLALLQPIQDAVIAMAQERGEEG